MGRKNRRKRLALKDLPKEVLVGCVEASGARISQTEIAGAIVSSKLKRASVHLKKHEEILAAALPVRNQKRRRQYEIEAQRHLVNCSTLFNAAKALAAEHGLTDQFFKTKEAR